MPYVSTPLKKEIVITELITIHYFEYMKDFVFHGESHNFWEFLYVDKGCVLVTADDLTYRLNAGDVIFHKPNEFHAIEALGEKGPNLVAVSFRTASPAMDFFIRKHFTLSPEERTILSHLIQEAKNSFSTPLHIPSVEQVIPDANAPFGAEQLISLYLELFFIYLWRSHAGSDALTQKVLPSTLKKPTDSELMDSIVQFMQLHICEQLTVSRICGEFSISRSSLQALFHKEKQCGAMDYFNNCKLELARELIRDGAMNLTEIAYFLSYSSLQYFSKQFKKASGMSPLEYSTSVKCITQTVRKLPPRKEE